VNFDLEQLDRHAHNTAREKNNETATHGTATRCKSRSCGAVPNPRARLPLLRAPPARERNGSGGPAPAAKRLSCLGRRSCAPAEPSYLPTYRTHERRNFSKHSERGRSQWLRASIRQRHRVQGQGPAKVRTSFEDAHPSSNVRILENPDDSFEDAQPFPRCARKVSTFAKPRADVLRLDCVALQLGKN
jgi:hypothetical protein